MPTIRKTPLITGEIYHVYNRGIDKRVTFTDQNEYARFFQTLKFYLYDNPPVSLSRFLRIGQGKRNEFLETPWGNKYISLFAYCIMPNHFHLLVRQEVDSGVSKFISQLLNSYTRYFNTKHSRVGQLFLDQFKNVLVDGEAQFLHLSRYIHLNPYSSGTVKTLGDLEKYEWSSLVEYIGSGEESICDKETVMFHFSSKIKYKEFIFDRAQYQKELEECEE